MGGAAASGFRIIGRIILRLIAATAGANQFRNSTYNQLSRPVGGLSFADFQVDTNIVDAVGASIATAMESPAF